MYNEDRKERFYQYKLDTSVKNIKPIQINIKRASKFEHIYKKDLCDFNINEITEMYKLLGFASIEGIVVMNNTLSHYANWCLNENLIKNGQNVYETMSSDVLSKLLNKALINHQIVSRETILTWAESFANPRDRFILLSFFEYGKSKLNFEDTVNARFRDIDEENHKMKLYSGRVVNVSDALIQFARISNNTFDVQLPYNRIKLVEDGTIIKRSNRTVENPLRLGRNVYNSLMRALSHIGVERMSIDKISTSGQIHMINSIANEKGISGREVVYDDYYKKEIENQFDVIIQPAYFMKKYSDYVK